MRLDLRPSRVSELVPFQACCTETLARSEFSSARCGVSEDGTFTWVYNYKGKALEVIKVSSGQRVATLDAEHVLNTEQASIACACEFHCQGRAQLLVAINGWAEQGLVVLLDVPSAMIVKAVEIPHQVTAVEKVLTHGGSKVPSWALSEQLRQFYGIVAVGTTGGYVYLLDMRVDCASTVDSSQKVRPSPLMILEPREQDVEAKRQQAATAGQHLALQLGVDEQTHSHECFHFRAPDLTVVQSFDEDEVQVSCIKYLPQCGTLAIGYNFGGYHLWRLFNPVLEYASPVEAEDLPVAAFVYQEPENDPRNFAYLWVCRDDHLSDIKVDSVCSMSLYQLSYSRRTFYAGYGNFFEELNSLALRLEHCLTVDPYNTRSNNTWCSQLLSAGSIADCNYMPTTTLTVTDSFDDGCQGPDLSLCSFVWEASGSGPGASTDVFLAIFDMNRWYHAQMPSRIKYVNVGGQEICPYFAVYRMNDAVNRIGCGSLLDIQLKPGSLLRFLSNSPMPPEQHFYPSSLTFDTVCILTNGITSATAFGVQRQVLAALDSSGPACLLKPFELYHRCLQAGLLARSAEIASTPASSEEQQRLALLTLALEQGKICFITSCIRSWAHGEYYQQGCTLQLLLSWAWARVTTIKQQIDVSCKPLFDWSGAPVDQRMLLTLQNCFCCLGHLKTVLNTLLTQSSPVTDQGHLELEHRIQVVTLLLGHLKVILWFVHSGLLPEQEETGELIGAQYVYPANELSQVFRDRRQQMKLLTSGGAEQPENDILIDALVHSAGPALSQLWKEQGSTGMYPPPSLHAALSMYLLDSVEERTKHCVMLYLLFDMAAVAHGQQEQFAEKIPRFARAFDVSLVLVQQIHGFWLIDHMNFEEGLRQMQPSGGQDLGPWQHRCILGALMHQGDARAALRYLSLRNPPAMTAEDVKMRLSVLVANRLVQQAVAYIRNSCGSVDLEAMLKHVFAQCQQRKLMELVLKLPLTIKEEKCLRDFLSSKSDSVASELLVLHLLQRSQYVPAIRLNDHLKHRATMDLSSKARERSKTRNCVVDGFRQSLPATQQDLINNPNMQTAMPTIQKIDVPRPKPLSTVVTQYAQRRANSQSTLIRAVIDKVAEAEKLLAEEEGEGYGETEEEEVAPSTHHQALKKDTTDRKEGVVSSRLGPFLSTPNTPSFPARLSGTSQVVFPSVKENIKVLLSSATLQSHPSTPAAINTTNRRSRVFTADCLSLLQTPKIDHTPVRLDSPLQRTTTPHSILKVSRLSRPESRSRDKNRSARTQPKRLGFLGSSPTTSPSLPLPSTPTTLTPSSTPSPTSSTGHHPLSQAAVQQSIEATPKQIRFAEPETREISPYVSPDNLGRPPLRLSPESNSTPPKGENDESMEETPAGQASLLSDEEITFNLCRQETEPMDSQMGSDSSTLPVTPTSPDRAHTTSPLSASIQLETSPRASEREARGDTESPLPPQSRGRLSHPGSPRLTRTPSKDDAEEGSQRASFRDRSPLGEDGENTASDSPSSPSLRSRLLTSPDRRQEKITRTSDLKETRHTSSLEGRKTEHYKIAVTSKETVSSTVVMEKTSHQTLTTSTEHQHVSSSRSSHTIEAMETVESSEERVVSASWKGKDKGEEVEKDGGQKTDIEEVAGDEGLLDLELRPPTPIQPSTSATPDTLTRAARSAKRSGLKSEMTAALAEGEEDIGDHHSPPKQRRVSPGRKKSTREIDWSESLPPLLLETNEEENVNVNDNNHMQQTSLLSIAQSSTESFPAPLTLQTASDQGGVEPPAPLSPSRRSSRKSAERSPPPPPLSSSRRSARKSVERSPPISPTRRSSRKSAERSPPPAPVSPSRRSSRKSAERSPPPAPVSPSRRSSRKSAERSPPPAPVSPSRRSSRKSAERSPPPAPVSPSRRSSRKSAERSPPPAPVSPSRRSSRKSAERSPPPAPVSPSRSSRKGSERSPPPPLSPSRRSTRESATRSAPPSPSPSRRPRQKSEEPTTMPQRTMRSIPEKEIQKGDADNAEVSATAQEKSMQSPTRRAQRSRTTRHSTIQEEPSATEEVVGETPRSPSRRSTRRSMTPDPTLASEPVSPSRRQSRRTTSEQTDTVSVSSSAKLNKEQPGADAEGDDSDVPSGKTSTSVTGRRTGGNVVSEEEASDNRQTVSPSRRPSQRRRSKTPEMSPGRVGTRLRSKASDSEVTSTSDHTAVVEQTNTFSKEQRTSSFSAAVTASPLAEEAGDAPSFQFAPPTPLSSFQGTGSTQAVHSEISASYIFSPPITRSTRLSTSLAAQSSLVQSERPEGRQDSGSDDGDAPESSQPEGEEEAVPLNRSSRKKSRSKKKSKLVVPGASPTDSPLNLVSPVQPDDSTARPQPSRQSQSSRTVYTRVLRKRKAKLW